MKNIIFNNIKFSSVSEKNFSYLINQKGLFVFPAGPALSKLDVQKKYHEALIKADYVFLDSGFFVLLLRLLKNIKVTKYSGYKFLFSFFEYLKKNKKKKIFNIDPDKVSSRLNELYFKKIGINKTYSYLAPKYNSQMIQDDNLINKLNKIKPDFILTNIGGGVQEILGFYLKKKLNFKTSIICTGAAIAFFTGKQAPINHLIDKLYIGWLFRIIYNPIIFLPRYLSAFKLALDVLKSKIRLK